MSLFISFEERTALYDEDTFRRLEYLDLATKCFCDQHWIVDDALKGGMWHYPARGDEHFVPTVPRLFVMLQSVPNVLATPLWRGRLPNPN